MEQEIQPQPQQPINPVPSPEKSLNNKVIAIVVLVIIAVAVGFIFLTKSSPVSTNQNNQPAIENKIYSVKEVLGLLSTNADYFKGQKIQLKAYKANITDGLGCSDYAVLMDKEDADHYKQLYDMYMSKDTSETQRPAISTQIQNVPSLKTGETLGMNQNIFPTVYAVYEGHFNDTSLSKNCPDGNKRFVVEKKIQELIEKTPNEATEQIQAQQEINPDSYKSIILEKNNPNYIKSKGAIKILFSQSATISFSIEKVNRPNTDFNNNSLPFVVYTNESTIPKDPNNNYVYGKYGDYSYTFTAPEIPGKYDVVFSEPELNSQKIMDVASKYEITVVGKVDNELLASKIADRAIFVKLNEANPRGWKIASQEIKSVGNSWDVVMQINYSSCGIDWESNVCTAKVVKGHYLINKSSGIVTETN